MRLTVCSASQDLSVISLATLQDILVQVHSLVVKSCIFVFRQNFKEVLTRGVLPHTTASIALIF